MALRHSIGEKGTCWRCELPYPWPHGSTCRRYERASNVWSAMSDVAREIALEEETRAALGTTPISRAEIIELVLRQPKARTGRSPAAERSA